MDDVVLAPARGDQEPFALSGGGALWDLLAESRTLDELVSGLALGGAADQATEPALLALLEDLRRTGVVEGSGS